MFYGMARGLVSAIFHIYFNIKIVGQENIPAEKGGYIIACNHVSNNDPPMVGIVFKGKYTFMAKEELFKSPIFAWLIRKLGAFPVKRGSKDMSVLKNAIDSLNYGRIFVIFPEGTRSKTGELGRPKSGVSLVAVQAKVPVVPVFIKYGKKRIMRRNVLVSIGGKIPGSEFENVEITDKQQIRAVSQRIMGEIAKLKENAPEIA